MAFERLRETGLISYLRWVKRKPRERLRETGLISYLGWVMMFDW